MRAVEHTGHKINPLRCGFGVWARRVWDSAHGQVRQRVWGLTSGRLWDLLRVRQRLWGSAPNTGAAAGLGLDSRACTRLMLPSQLERAYPMDRSSR